jgi:hypothetical protein
MSTLACRIEPGPPMAVALTTSGVGRLFAISSSVRGLVLRAVELAPETGS